MKIQNCVENSPLWWKLIIGMKFHICDKIYQFNENWWLSWRVLHCVTIVIKMFDHCNKDSWLWWNFLIVKKIHHYDEISSYLSHYVEYMMSAYWHIQCCFTKSCYIGLFFHFHGVRWVGWGNIENKDHVSQAKLKLVLSLAKIT